MHGLRDLRVRDRNGNYWMDSRCSRRGLGSGTLFRRFHLSLMRCNFGGRECCNSGERKGTVGSSVGRLRFVVCVCVCVCVHL